MRQPGGDHLDSPDPAREAAFDRGASAVKRPALITASILAVMVLAIVVALVLEVGSGPTFRAEDHDSYQECIRNIPAEWGPGSMQRTGAEDACRYVHQHRR